MTEKTPTPAQANAIRWAARVPGVTYPRADVWQTCVSAGWVETRHNRETATNAGRAAIGLPPAEVVGERPAPATVPVARAETVARARSVAEALRELAGDPADPSSVIVSRAYLLKLAAQLDG